MECREVARLLPEYLDAALADRRSDEIEAHLSSCDSCSAYVDQIRDMISAARHLRTPTGEASSKGRILRLYERWTRRRRPWM